MGMNDGYVTEDDIDADLFGEPDRSTVEFLRDKVERYAPRIRDAFGGFFEDAREVFERHSGENALRRIRARVRRTANSFSRDVVRPLRTIGDIQNARPTMQRYVMANLMARKAAEAQEIDGYSDSYMTPYPGRRGLQDPDYMRAIDGVIFDDDRYGIQTDTAEDAWVAYQSHDQDPDERDLDVVEQMDVFSTWDLLERLLAEKQRDPTSVLNEKM